MYPLPPRPLQWGEAVKMGGSGGEPWMGEAVWWPEAEEMGRDRERPLLVLSATEGHSRPSPVPGVCLSECL